MAPILISILSLFSPTLSSSLEHAALGGDTLYGTCYSRSGELCAKNNHRISTSWNSLKAYPDRNGNYEFQFDGSVGRRITVYCDGSRVGDVLVDGRTHFNVYCR